MIHRAWKQREAGADIAGFVSYLRRMDQIDERAAILHRAEMALEEAHDLQIDMCRRMRGMAVGLGIISFVAIGRAVVLAASGFVHPSLLWSALPAVALGVFAVRAWIRNDPERVPDVRSALESTMSEPGVR